MRTTAKAETPGITFTHDHARSRAYRWGEDGLAGISDDRQRLCFALALWNGKDPILKERLFGLTDSEGNHGEDVKEYYFYLDSTPTHSYMKYLYKYPQAAYPYDDLVATNRDRGRGKPEYELLDTGVFDQDRYFDVFVEYAKASPEDMLIQITVHNRGPEPATLQLLPTLWFRNDWSWGEDVARPTLRQVAQDKTGGIVALSHRDLGERFFYAEGASALLFTENETNTERLVGMPNPSPYVKDGINNYIVHGKKDAVNPEKKGTKVSAHYPLTLGAGESRTIRLRLSDQPVKDSKKALGGQFGKAFESVFKTRLQEADEFYATVIPPSFNPDEARVMRQALAGMLWSKQFFFYDVGRWLKQHGIQPYKANQRSIRNDRWGHMVNADVISMPDKWEYPWYAAWDLAFHVTALTLVDEDFGKEQLELFLKSRYLHPSGQIPAYEWNFGDVNPPVHAWSTIFTYLTEKAQRWEGRSRLARALFPQAAAQLQLVGEPKRPCRKQCVRRGIPGAGQYRGLRPVCAFADRRISGTGRWHRLDGPLLPEHGRDRRRAGDGQSGLYQSHNEIPRALPPDRFGDDPAGRGRRDVG